ncbi:MAG: ABC transporter permease [Burkholderiales bacterium]|nr:ABC transporter permease [Burkholderiales bacterium]
MASRVELWSRLIASEWRHQPGRLALALLALAVGVALAYAVFLVNASALAEFGQAVRSVNGQPDLDLRASAGDNSSFDEALYTRVAQQPGLTMAAPMLEITAVARRVDAGSTTSDTVGTTTGAAAPAGSSAAAAATPTTTTPTPPVASKATPGAVKQMPTLRVVGVDALTLARIAPDLLPRPHADAPRLAMLDPQLVFLNAAARRALGVQTPGELLRLSANGRHVVLRWGGDVATSGGALAVVDIAGVQQGFGLIGRISRIAVQLEPGVTSADWLRRLDLPPTVRAAAPDEAEQRLSQLSRSYRVNLSVLALVALFTGAFLVYAVQALAVAKRLPQLALLGVLGMPAAERRALVLVEATLLGVLGSAIGLGLGAVMAQQALARLGGDLGSAGMLGGLFGASAAPPLLHWSVASALGHGALGLAAALAGSWFPARAAEKLAPAQTLKGVGSAQLLPSRLARWSGPAMLVVGGLLALLPPLPGLQGLPLPAYLSIGLILLGGVVCVPALVGLVLDRLPPSMSPLPLLVIERARDQRSSATATVSGVVASLALCVALTVMVASFRDSVASWLDRILPADLYVRASGMRASGLVQTLPIGLDREAARLPGVDHVRPQRLLAVQLDARQAAVALLSRPLPMNGSTTELAAELPLIGDALPARAGCINVAVSEALAALYDAPAGSVLTLPLAMGAGTGTANSAATTASKSSAPSPCAPPRAGRVEVYVRAVWRDYSRQQGALMMDRADWLALGGDETVNDLALWLKPDADMAQVQAALRELAVRLSRGQADASGLNTTPAGSDAERSTDDRLDLAGLEFATPGEIRAISLTIFDRSFVVTRWLQVVAIALGLVGVAASFSAQVLARRKEFGALQHLGVTRRQLLLLVAGEGALWCGLGALLGLVLGLVISVVLVDVVNPQSFHWTMELALPWDRLGALVGAVLLAGAIAATVAGRSAASQQMALAVKEDW